MSGHATLSLPSVRITGGRMLTRIHASYDEHGSEPVLFIYLTDHVSVHTDSPELCDEIASLFSRGAAMLRESQAAAVPS